MKGKEIQEQINSLTAQLWAVENNIKNSSAEILVEEVLNLMSGIGITEGDYYAKTRLYSSIEGVKNIRFFNSDTIGVKVVSPIGALLPDSITIGDKTYKIQIFRSEKFSESMDY